MWALRVKGLIGFFSELAGLESLAGLAVLGSLAGLRCLRLTLAGLPVGAWAVLRANAWAAELGGAGLPLGSSAGLAVSGLTWCSVSVPVAAGGNETGDGDAICVMSWLSSGCLSCGQPPLGDSDWP